MPAFAGMTVLGLRGLGQQLSAAKERDNRVIAFPMRGNLIRIIGIDPGLRRTGWGIIESDGVRLSYVASGHITSDSQDDLAYRLREIFEGLSSVIASFRPLEAAVEETFVNDNARATLKLGQARGIALLAPAVKGLKVAEYQPNLIKKSVTGTGHGDKKQIQAMVGFLLPKAKFESADEADALAIAICHANHRASAQALKRVAARIGV
ncbi:crossover junction endodeoxyribonuclease RuvC [Leptospira interrogans]